MTAQVIDLGARRRPPLVRRRSHGSCVECGSMHLVPLAGPDDPAPLGVRCDFCGLVLSIEEHHRRRGRLLGGIPDAEGASP